MSFRECPVSVCETCNTVEIEINHSPLKVYVYLGTSASHTCLQEIIEIHSVHSQISLSGRLKNKQGMYWNRISGGNTCIFQISNRTLLPFEGLSH